MGYNMDNRSASDNHGASDNPSASVIPTVEAEIVEDIPDSSYAIPVVGREDIPKDAVPAPDPKRLRQGYFQKGGRGGPGRKRFYQNPAEMEAECNKYFESLLVASLNESTGRMEYTWRVPPTIPGLARALGMTDVSLKNYAERDEFAPVVDWAVGVIKEYLETGVVQPGNQSGKIFLMKNLGYSDMQTITYAPPSRLQAAQSPDEIAKLVDEDIV